MKAVIQRVSSANVSVGGKTVGECNKGYMILLGVQSDDTERDLETLIKKVVNLRIFEDNDEKMNLSLLDIDGEVLCIHSLLCVRIQKKATARLL